MKIDNRISTGMQFWHLEESNARLDVLVKKAEAVINQQQSETKQLLKVGFLGLTALAAFAAIKAVAEAVCRK
jgi:hypothetical protein